jgi:hypothetical protein
MRVILMATYTSLIVMVECCVEIAQHRAGLKESHKSYHDLRKKYLEATGKSDIYPYGQQ